MSSPTTICRRSASARAAAFFSLALSLLLFTIGTQADDRFNVPTSSSNASTTAPSQPTTPSPTNTDNTSSPPPDSGRFNVPVPSSNSSQGPGGIGGGQTYNPYSPYWGGYYYCNGDYYYWGGQRYLSDTGSFGRYPFFPGPGHDYPDERQSSGKTSPVFFPPSAPPIGAPVPPKQPAGERTVAPAELANYVYEPFYGPLGTRLAAKDLTKKLLLRLDAYQTRRRALQNELQEKLGSLKDAPTTDRIQKLETFAREQTPHIAELEATADQLRSDLLRSGLIGLFSGTGNWNQSRNWALGQGPLARPREQTLVYEFLVMRAAVFYQEGLSSAQRRLLREVAMEVQVEAFKPKAQEGTKNESSLVFFSPETARISVSDDWPADLLAKIDAYQSEKSAIKTELRDVLYQEDSGSSTHRAQALKQLAEDQTPRLAALEGLAEDIRAGLSRLPKQPGPSAPPAFPPALAARISAYQTEKLNIQKLIQSKLDEIRTRLAPEAMSLTRKSADETSSATYKLEGTPHFPEEKIALVREAVADLNRQNAQRFDALNKERDALRDEVARFASAHPDMTGERSVHTLLHDFFTALREEETWQPYQDYQTAVYQPGLSPEQRRLLFEVALEKLALPLPDGEFLQ